MAIKLLGSYMIATYKANIPIGYTRGVYGVPLTIQTYDGVIKVHGMVLVSSPGQFPFPTWPRSEGNMI